MREFERRRFALPTSPSAPLEWIKLLDETGDHRLQPSVSAEGQTDYLAVVHRFGADGVIGEMDCVYSSWTTDVAGGFEDDQVNALTRALSHSSAGDQVPVAGPDRRDAGGDLPRPRCRTLRS